MNWTAFFHMGGYGQYVWPAYAFVAILLIWNIVLPLRARGAVVKRVRAVAASRTATAAAPAAKHNPAQKERS